MKRKTLSILCTSILLINAAWSNLSCAAAEGGIFIDDMMLDIGYVETGKTRRAIFKVVNITESDFVVESVSPDCKCMIAEDWSHEKIHPSDTFSLAIEFRPEMSGPFQRTVELTIDSQPTPILLALRGRAK